MPKEKKQFSLDVGGKPLTLEISGIAGQTNAAVMGKYGGTVVLVSVVMTNHDASVDYMPLKVDYEERFYAAGKIIGSRFIRREGRPSEEAILSGRLVDRTIRPLFDSRLRREVQVVLTVLSFDEENDPDFVGLIAASTALGISDVPWDGPVAGVRVVKKEKGGATLVNCDNSQFRNGDHCFDAFVAGPKNHINMIELGGDENMEADILASFTKAQEEINRLAEFQEKIIKEIGKPKAKIAFFEVDPNIRAAIEKFLALPGSSGVGRLEEAVYQKSKADQHQLMGELRKELISHLEEQFPDADRRMLEKAVHVLFEDAVDRLVHKNILERDKRPDGRKLDEVRELHAEVGLLDRTHGSAIFMRGTTQALAVTTLAPPGQEQLIETMEMTGKRRFMLHYNFPPYSVGEVGSFRGPGRREIGHGALAEKAIRRLLPSKDEFPYTIRVVSEILSSNGSSSMATVCASTLSLMDAGVPMRTPAAGIAMGLMTDEKGNFKVLTDIQGPEDYYGDMDLKVAGAKNGITAIQMDTKMKGAPLAIIEKTIMQAREARLHILNYMQTVLPAPRPQISPRAPFIQLVKINPEKIGMVIGPGGKMINGLIRQYELTGIDIEEDGRVYVSGPQRENVRKVVEEIKGMTREFAVGEFVEGKVVKVLDFGAIVDLGGGLDGMIHVSELKEGFTKNVGDVVKVGDFVRAKIIRLEEGRIALSIKQV